MQKNSNMKLQNFNKSDFKVLPFDYLIILKGIKRKKPFMDIAQWVKCTMSELFKKIHELIEVGVELNIDYHIDEHISKEHQSALLEYWANHTETDLEETIRCFSYDSAYSKEDIQLMYIKYLTDKNTSSDLQVDSNAIEKFQDHSELFRVCEQKTDRIGYADKTGKLVVKPQYSRMSGFSEGMACVCVVGDTLPDAYIPKDKSISYEFVKYSHVTYRKKCIYDMHPYAPIIPGKTYLSPSITCNGERDAEGHELCEIEQTYNPGKWGFIDPNGTIVIEPQFDNASCFNEGLAKIQIGDKWGFIDPTGNIVIQPQFEYVSDFHEGRAIIQRGEKYGFIDQTGKIIAEPQFDEYTPFSNGYAIVEKDDCPGFIDKLGNVIITPQYITLSNFHEDVAAFYAGKSDYGYIYKSGRVIFQSPDFDEEYDLYTEDTVGDCNEDYENSIDDYFISMNGQRAYWKFQEASFFHEGLAPVWDEETDRWGFVNESGEMVIPYRFDYADHFSEGLAWVGLEDENGDNKYGFIDKSGELVIDAQYDPSNKNRYSPECRFHGGIALIRKDGKDGYINQKGEWCFDYYISTEE